MGSIINNKPLHDFYNKTGLNVMNIHGEVWREYGDNNMLKEPTTRDTAINYLFLDQVANETFKMASLAVTTSLTELFNHFIEAAEGSAAPLKIPDNTEDIKIRVKFYTENCTALQVTPLPYNSHLENFFSNADTLKALQPYNWLLPYRNYIRHRVANTILFDYGFAHPSDFSSSAFLFSSGLRFILSGKRYSYTDRVDKKGTFDQWRGLTLSYHLNFYPEDTLEGETDFVQYRHQIQGGFYRCFDYWVGRKRFLNFHGYLEGGVQIIGSKVQTMLTPSIGMELLPLLGFNRKPLPRAISIPLELILPVKFLVSYQMIHGQKPQWVISNQIDLVF
jgi:hypothetical protein